MCRQSDRCPAHALGILQLSRPANAAMNLHAAPDATSSGAVLLAASVGGPLYPNFIRHRTDQLHGAPMITTAHAEPTGLECERLGKAANISIQLATILMRVAHNWDELRG